MDSSPPPPQSRGRSWSIHGRTEITSRYEILHRVGSGAYSDVYRARRKSDGLPVALKEIHDYQSAFREIEALQLLRNAPNVVHLIEYFWQDDENEDAVLVLEFLESDLASVVKDGRKREGGIGVGEVKAWMLQILRGVDACHQNGVVHRDLKPLNLLISGEGVLKLADFGQSRILQEQRYISEEKSIEHGASRDAWTALQELQHPHSDVNSSWPEGTRNQDTSEVACEEDCYEEVDGLKAKYAMDDTVSWKDGEASCVATCCTTDVEDDPLKGHEIFEPYEGKEADDSGELTSCVGTRWYRAPELLYGSTSYAHEIDLWSLGCIFAELLNLQPLFPGISDIDQLARIINTLGNATEETWIGCSKLPDYGKISFNKIDNPLGLESHLPNRSSLEVSIVKRLLCYNPINRASAKELLQERYFTEEPLPDPLSELKVPVKSDEQDDSLGDWHDGSESDTEWFGNMDISKNEKGFSIQFS